MHCCAAIYLLFGELHAPVLSYPGDFLISFLFLDVIITSCSYYLMSVSCCTRNTSVLPFLNVVILLEIHLRNSNLLMSKVKTPC